MKESACNAGYPGSISGLGRSGKKNSYPLQYCLENPMDRGAWWGTVHGVVKSLTHFRSPQSAEFPVPYTKFSLLNVFCTKQCIYVVH